jgi:plastocyanin
VVRSNALWVLVIASTALLTAIGSASAEKYIVEIPPRAADPSFDPQFARPDDFYSPPNLTVNVNDTVTWINNDSEKHTVTSGLSSGRTGFVRGDLGTPDGIFDSGLFESKQEWSYTFTFPGTFPYFCTLHPWMFGVVQVQGTIPDYPQDAQGNKVELPVMTLTGDPSYHVGTSWSPKVLRTGEQVTFINDFFDSGGTKKQHLLEYEFVILQDDKEVHRSLGFSENGADIKNFVFSQPGPVAIRFENVGGVAGNNAEFLSFVYQGTGQMSAEAIISTNEQDPTFITAGIYLAIFGPLGGAVVLWMYYWKPWKPKQRV